MSFDSSRCSSAARVGTPDLDLAHVRDVEHARVLADGQVLGLDARVLQRHLVASEADELGARSDMTLMQRAAP